MDLKASQEIDDYIGNDSSADTGKTIKIPYKGSHTEFTVYRLPTKLLRFRLENTRFEVQKMQDEATNGPIDPDEEAGEKRLIKLLLGTPKNKDLVSLRGSIERDGQLQPGAITYDGAVINGNRRMACIKVLYEETSQDKFQYFDCVRIPKGATEEDIFKLETYFQWAKEYRVDYSPINNYMMLKKAITLKWKPEQIAEQTNRDLKKIKESIEELRLIDDYLIHIGHPEQYYLLEGQTEVFTDAAGQVTSLKSKRDIDNLARYKKIIFNFGNINSKEKKTITYEDIRKLNKAFNQENEDAIAIFEQIKPTDSFNDIREMLAKAIQHVDFADIFGKPEKIAQRLKEDAERLKRQKLIQGFTPKVSQIITEVIKMLKELND